MTRPLPCYDELLGYFTKLPKQPTVPDFPYILAEATGFEDRTFEASKCQPIPWSTLAVLKSTQGYILLTIPSAQELDHVTHVTIAREPWNAHKRFHVTSYFGGSDCMDKRDRLYYKATPMFVKSGWAVWIMHQCRTDFELAAGDAYWLASKKKTPACLNALIRQHLTAFLELTLLWQKLP